MLYRYSVYRSFLVVLNFIFFLNICVDNTTLEFIPLTLLYLLIDQYLCLILMSFHKRSFQMVQDWLSEREAYFRRREWEQN